MPPRPSDEPLIVNSISDFEFEQNFNGSELDLDFASLWFLLRLEPGEVLIDSPWERSQLFLSFFLTRFSTTVRST